MIRTSKHTLSNTFHCNKFIESLCIYVFASSFDYLHYKFNFSFDPYCLMLPYMEIEDVTSNTYFSHFSLKNNIKLNWIYVLVSVKQCLHRIRIYGIELGAIIC